jgi:hypothetical protein
MRAPSFVFLASAAIVACSSAGPNDAANADAADADGASDAIDTHPDALDADAPAHCLVDGIVGQCIDVSTCTGDRVATPGHCPGPANIQCCTPRIDADASVDSAWSGDTSGWCPTDASARPNAGLAEETYDARCPSGMIPITTFCIDKYEAELVVKDGSGVESSWSPYYPPPAAGSGLSYRAVSIGNAVPQGYISGAEAKVACTASGKRMCTNDEWLRACQGPSGFTFPYGDTRETGVCNDHRDVHPAIQCFGTDASWIWSEIQWPGINQQAATVDRTGTRTGCVTAEGAFDMMGNLHEWVEDPVVNFRGGYYVDTIENGPGCLYQTTAHNFLHWDYSTGFRCCADVK